MLKRYPIIIILFFSTFISCSEKKIKRDPLTATHYIFFETTAGNFKAELYGFSQVKTTKNFVKYAEKNFYEGLIFHRVIKSFMIQGGGFDVNMKQKVADKPIKLEVSSHVKHNKYVLSMARTGNPDSATTQFFIMTNKKTHLDSNSMLNKPNGYAAFGKIVEGTKIIDKIASVKVGNKNGHPNVPVKPISILKTKVVSLIKKGE